jgi:hypothetical protein
MGCLGTALLMCVACGDEQTTRSEAVVESTTEQKGEESVDSPKKVQKTETAPMVQERSTFKTEVTSFGVYDSKLHKVPLPDGYDDDLPGPRLLVIGHIQNTSGEPIHRGGVFGHLKVCAADDKCVERPSHGRGFTVPLSGEEPWRAGTWRHFTVLTRAADPIYRELRPSQVNGRLVLMAEGPVSVDWEGEIWNSRVPWKSFGGYPVMKEATLAEALKSGSFNLGAGAPIRVLAIAGMKAFIKSGTRSAWVPLEGLPLDKEFLSHIATATTLPVMSRGPGLKVTVHGTRFHITTPKDKKSGQERFLVADVEIETSMEAKGRINASAFNLISGSDKKSTAERKSTITNRLLTLGTIERGTKRRGDVVFKLPFGVNPLVLTVTADKTSYLEVVFP